MPTDDSGDCAHPGESAPATDGRVRRGLARKQQLLDAALRVIARAGVAAVTHRAVAAEAALPKSAATYYYPKIDDLLVAALTDSADRYAAELESALGGTGTAQLAEQIAQYVNDNRERSLAEYELYLLAGRRPALRAPALRWLDILREVGHRYTDDSTAVESLVTTVDGIILQALLRGESLDPSTVQRVLDHVLGNRTGTE